MEESDLLTRRRRFADAASLMKRSGAVLFVIASVSCLVGFWTTFSNGSGWLMIASLLVGSALLLPGIVLGYAVKAAERHDLGLPDGH